MKCPLIKEELITRADFTQYKTHNCIKKECAWWIPAFKVCSVLEIAIRLGSLADNVFSIMDKMPHEGQFRK